MLLDDSITPSLVVALPTPKPPEKYPSPTTASVASGCVVVPPPKMFEYPMMFPVACKVLDAYTDASVLVANTSESE